MKIDVSIAESLAQSEYSISRSLLLGPRAGGKAFA